MNLNNGKVHNVKVHNNNKVYNKLLNYYTSNINISIVP